MTESQRFFDKAYFGKIFDVIPAGEKKKHQPQHIVTSWLYLDVYSSNFSKRLHHINSHNVSNVSVKNDTVTIHMKDTPLKYETDNPDELKAAATPIIFEKESIAPFQAPKIFQSMGISLSDAETLKNKCGEAAQQLFQLLMKRPPESPSVPPFLIDLFACIMKARHVERQEPFSALEAAVKGLRMHIMTIWLDAVITAAQLEDIEQEYIDRIIVNLAETIAALGDANGISTRQFVSATAFYYEQKSTAGVVREAKRLQEELSQLVDTAPIVQRLYLMATVAHSARIAGTLVYTGDRIRDLAVEMVTSMSESGYTEAIDDVIRTSVGDMLRRLNDRRYEPEFQHVFALWKYFGKKSA